MPDTTYLAPTTELEAVNAMLRSIGESPIASLTDIAVQDAEIALTTLRSVSRSVQVRGWDFNTEIEMELVVNGDGNIPLPSNTLSVDPVDETKKLVQRGSRLYDPVEHTYVFTDPVTVNLIVMLPFEELPEAARNYIFVRAARQFQDNTVGDSSLHRYQTEDEEEARATFMQTAADTEDNNILNDSWSVARILNRDHFS
jgi:hypothetical protein